MRGLFRSQPRMCLWFKMPIGRSVDSLDSAYQVQKAGHKMFTVAVVLQPTNQPVILALRGHNIAFPQAINLQADSLGL